MSLVNSWCAYVCGAFIDAPRKYHDDTHTLHYCRYVSSNRVQCGYKWCRSAESHTGCTKKTILCILAYKFNGKRTNFEQNDGHIWFKGRIFAVRDVGIVS